MAKNSDPSLTLVFAELQSLLKKYQSPLVARVDLPTKYELWSEKEIIIAGRKRTDMYFAGLVIQKSYVGLYFMPVYTHPELTAKLKPGFLSTLKGKSCFHIKKLEASLKTEIQEALQAGFELYQDNGWI